MGTSLAEYAAQHPAPERESMAPASRSPLDGIAERERIRQLKESIARKIQEGTPPQYVLYAALQVIGLSTGDPEWAEAQACALDSIYNDLAQQSLFTEAAEREAERLDHLQAEYREKTRRQLQHQIGGCRRIIRALTDALDALDGTAPQERDH